METLSRYWRILRVQIKNNFVREAVYRTNFITTVIVDLIWIAVQFALFTVLYSNVPTLAGWTKEQTFFFLGIFFASDAIFSTFFARNFWMFSDLVNRGELDVLLTKPAHPIFLALTRFLSMTAWFNVVLGLGVAAKYAPAAGFAGGWHWLLVIPWLAIANFAAVLLRFAFSIWIFWTDRSWAISRLYFAFFNLADKPDPIFPWIVRRTLLTILPFAFIGSVPARALIHGLTAYEYLEIAIVLAGFTLLNATLWRLGLKRYQSASS